MERAADLEVAEVSYFSGSGSEPHLFSKRACINRRAVDHELDIDVVVREVHKVKRREDGLELTREKCRILGGRTAFLHSKKRKAARCARDGVQSIFAVQKFKLAFFN